MERTTSLLILLILILRSCRTQNISYTKGTGSGLVLLSQMASSSAPSGFDIQQHQEDLRCYNFSIGQPFRQEFYSPGYPSSYPPKIDCILVLRAAYGQVIRVDFRDQFDIEPHPQCLYDFLAVRDGAHGYSPLVDRYCGRTFPPVITSTENFLWLRFSSDENIEYTGFRAVYQFLPDPRPTRPAMGSCRFEMSGLDGTFSRRDISEELISYSRDYHVPLDCTWVITVEEHQKIQLSFPAYALANPNECDLNFIEIFGDKTDMQNRLRHFCGSAVDVVLSKTNVIHLRFYVQPSAIRSTFDALFTAVTPYRETEAAPKCVANEFDCEDSFCVDMSLRCNGRTNCRFRYDEENCKVVRKKVMSSDHIIVILTIFCLTLFGLCFSCFYRCARKLKADHQVYQTRRSRSREDRLDVFDETSPHQSKKRSTGTAAGSAASFSAPKASMSSIQQYKHRPGRNAALAGADPDPDDCLFQQRSMNSSRSLSSPFMLNGFGDVLMKMEKESIRPHPSEPVITTSAGVAESSGRDTDEDEDDDEEEVEMVDHACQTRESLFDDPQPVVVEERTSYSSGGGLPRQHPYRAERMIEMPTGRIVNRNVLPSNQPVRTTTNSSSAASSKSGADVVVLH